MQDVPRETLGQHLGFGFGFGRDEEEGRDELDERLARQYFLCQTQIHADLLNIQNMQDMYTIYKIPTLQLKIQKVPIPGTLMNHQVVKTTGDVVLTVHPPPPE